MPLHVKLKGGLVMELSRKGCELLVAAWEYSSTRAMELSASEATALTRMLAGVMNTFPLVGLRSDTSGRAVWRVMLTGAEVPCAPWLSIACALRTCAPTVALLQA